MGFAVRRADGTYRCWNRNTQDDTLQSGETWEERDDAPTITLDPETDAEKWARKTAAPVTPDDLLAWLLDELNAVRAALPSPQPAIALAEARNAIVQHKLRKGG